MQMSALSGVSVSEAWIFLKWETNSKEENAGWRGGDTMELREVQILSLGFDRVLTIDLARAQWSNQQTLQLPREILNTCFFVIGLSNSVAAATQCKARPYSPLPVHQRRKHTYGLTFSTKLYKEQSCTLFSVSHLSHHECNCQDS